MDLYEDATLVEFPMVDLKGKQIGEIRLRTDAVKILDITRVDLIMRYNWKTKEVTAWLE